MNQLNPLHDSYWPEKLPHQYWLSNAKIPQKLLDNGLENHDLSALHAVHIVDGKIAAVQSMRRVKEDLGDNKYVTTFDLKGAMVFSCFVDPHTHLDKGDLLATGLQTERNLLAAVAAVQADYVNWSQAELTTRINFALRTAYAHGCRALNSYCDWSDLDAPLAWQVLSESRQNWRGKVDLTLTALAPIEIIENQSDAHRLASTLKESAGNLGFFIYPAPHITELLPKAFDLAQKFDLTLDLHIDEHLYPTTTHLGQVATLAKERHWGSRTICGHASVLSTLEPELLDQTLDKMADAGLSLVSLPSTNLHLQDSSDTEPFRSPRFRGIAPLHEAKARGIPVALGCDNHRDIFHPYGDLDPLQNFSLAALALQFENPCEQWIETITTQPAELLSLHWQGKIEVGAPADLVMHSGRNSAEVLSRVNHHRMVIRAGHRLSLKERTPPDFRELDLARSFTDQNQSA